MMTTLLKNSLKVVFLTTLLISCVTKTDEDQSKEQHKKYSYLHDNSVMEWTAFKFESKAPVKGTFADIRVSSLTEADDAKELANSLSFTIPISSISTTDDSRDAKIIEFFFGVMSTQELTGRITNLSEDGKVELEVKMNNITEKINGEYKLNDNLFSINATMDLTKWNAQQAIEVLNENCKENHTENGITKMWDEVNLSFTTKFVQK